MTAIHVIGRILVVSKGHLLVCRFRDAAYCFLPGGQVEYNEDVRSAIKREIREELGSDAQTDQLLGVIEQSFPLDGGPFHEYSFIFTGTIEDCSPPDAPPPLEDGLVFSWLPLASLRDTDLKPPPLADMVAEYVVTGRATGWASTMSDMR
jgi:8-oxo-dGTP pyrophosphatase MutT (NUDIX family)